MAADFGSVGIAGDSTYTNSTGLYVVRGSGVDIWANADGGHLVYRTLVGDWQLTAHVVNVPATDAWAKAGVMVRENLGAGSRNAFMMLSRSNGVMFQTRATANGGTGYVWAQGISAPYWLRLIRRGDLFTGCISSDGLTWRVIGSQTIPMSSSVYVGLAVTSHNNTVLGTAEFDGVNLVLPWNSSDIGTETNPGTTAFDPATGTFTLNAAGSGQGSVNDSLRFEYGSLKGNGEIQGRLIDFQNAGGTSFGGLSLRSSLSQDAPHVTLALTATGDSSLTARSTGGGSSTSLSLGTLGVPPRWLKLVRRSDDIRAFSSSDGFNWQWLGTANPPAGSLGPQVLAGLALSSGNNTVFTQSHFDNVSAAPTWVDQDIGSVGFLKDVSHDLASGRILVKASGADIWGGADAFTYVYQPLIGDGEIFAKVTSMTNTDSWAKAGLMIRENTASSAREVSMLIRPSAGALLQNRASPGGATNRVDLAGLTPPYWLRLVRRGSQFTGYYSPEGISWTQFTSVTVAMGNQALIGLAVTSHNNGAICTVPFDGISTLIDNDKDLLIDDWENQHFGGLQESASSDPDQDGASNMREYLAGTDPLVADSDGDGMSDGFELDRGLNPLANDNLIDSDGDGLTNAQEYLANSNPFLADTDGDGVSDSQDAYPLDPTRWQSPVPDPNDHTPPTIILTAPANAVLLP